MFSKFANKLIQSNSYKHQLVVNSLAQQKQAILQTSQAYFSKQVDFESHDQRNMNEDKRQSQQQDYEDRNTKFSQLNQQRDQNQDSQRIQDSQQNDRMRYDSTSHRGDGIDIDKQRFNRHNTITGMKDSNHQDTSDTQYYEQRLNRKLSDQFGDHYYDKQDKQGNYVSQIEKIMSQMNQENYQRCNRGDDEIMSGRQENDDYDRNYVNLEKDQNLQQRGRVDQKQNLAVEMTRDQLERDSDTRVKLHRSNKGLGLRMFANEEEERINKINDAHQPAYQQQRESDQENKKEHQQIEKAKAWNNLYDSNIEKDKDTFY